MLIIFKKDMSYGFFGRESERGFCKTTEDKQDLC